MISRVKPREDHTLHTPPVNIERLSGSAAGFIVRLLGCEGCEGCLVHLSREGAHTHTHASDSPAITLHTLHRGKPTAIYWWYSAQYRNPGVKGVRFTPLHGPSRGVSA